MGLESTFPRLRSTWHRQLLQDFSPLVLKLEELEIEPLLIGGDANENGLVVLPLVDDDHAVALQESYRRCLATDQSMRDERKQRLPVVHVGIETGGDAQFPTEMIDVILEVQPTGWWSLFGSSSKKTRQSAQLAGWSHFDLNGTLCNISELQKMLTKVSFVRSQ